MKTNIFFKTLLIPVITLFILCLYSCKGYLDLKPDKSRVLPKTVSDAQAILDNYYVMNTLYPGEGEAAADNYTLPDANASSLQLNDRNNYIWAAQGEHSLGQWLNPYKVVFNSNLALQVLNDLPATELNYNEVKGTALFFRAYAHYQVAQLFANAYGNTSTTDPGIPIRLSPDLDVKSERGTVKQTYEQILSDLHDAVSLLPITVTVKSRPNKAAAYAMLARAYLAMSDYTNAGTMADESLKLYNTLMDYKTLTTPISRFNPEVLFHTENVSTTSLNPFAARVDEVLYASYEANDKRKTIFFNTNVDGSHGFNSSYTGVVSNIIFSGLATDEVYLIRAECFARAGNTTAAMADLNILLKNRYDNTFVAKTASSPQNALDIILVERRKELIIRGLRWTDLRRLNKESRYAIALTRVVNGVTYALPPNSQRYTLLIPMDVISSSGIAQNPRVSGQP